VIRRTGGEIAMGLKHGPEQVGARRRKRALGIGIRREREGARCKGSSVCNSPRWCEAMRCDRPAMSCGRPDGPAAVPCPPELSA